MPYVKSIPLRTTVNRSLAYILNPDKTENLLYTNAVNCLPNAKDAYLAMKWVYEHFSGEKYNAPLPKQGKGSVKAIHYIQCSTQRTISHRSLPTKSRWFVEGDIKGCFDNIDHQLLVGLIRNKIKDARIIKLIYNFLKAGYMENFKYHKTYSGTPHGGIISPLLANIYLHELDKFVMTLKKDFDKPSKDTITPEYREAHNELKRISYRLKKSAAGNANGFLRNTWSSASGLRLFPARHSPTKELNMCAMRTIF